MLAVPRPVAMQKKLNLSHLTDEECNKIMDVLQKDFEVRRFEKKKINDARDELMKEQNRIALLKEKQSFNETSCIICLERFGLIFHRKRKCYICNLNVCSACCQRSQEKKKGLICQVCSKEKAFKMLSNQWFFNSSQINEKTFGSSKVVQSLNKRHTGLPADSDVSNSATVDLNIRQMENIDEDEWNEAFDIARKDEELKFKVQFEKLLEDLQISLQEDNPEEQRTNFASPSGMEVMFSFKDKVKELLREFTERLQLAYESFGSADTPADIRRAVKQNVGKFIENFIGESLDQASDGAISDLYLLSDDNLPDQCSFEDLLAHSVISKLLENHQGNVSETQRSPHGTTLQEDKLNYSDAGSQNTGNLKQHPEIKLTACDDDDINENITDSFSDSGGSVCIKSQKEKLPESLSDSADEHSEKNVDNPHFNSMQTSRNAYSDIVSKPRLKASSNNDETHFSNNMHQYSNASSGTDANDLEMEEFQELKDFVKNTPKRPKLETADFDDSNLYDIEEEMIVKREVDRDEIIEGFKSKYMILDRIHNARSPLPEISQFDSLNFASDEIDPDLLSLNLDIIPEEAEEELEEETEEMDGNVRLKTNWIFKGKGFSPYKNIGNPEIRRTWDGSHYLGVPGPDDNHLQRTGNRNFDLANDFSDIDGSDEEESTFYANTSKELARIARQHKRLNHLQQQYSGSYSDDSDKNGKLVQQTLLQGDKNNLDNLNNSVPSVESSKQELKLLQDLIPAENDDPKFLTAPESVTIQEGEPVKLSCRVAGSGHVDVFWYREREEVEELEDSSDVEISSNGDKHNIIIYNINKKMGGQYMCIAMNETGKAIQYLVVTVKDSKQALKKPEFLKGLKDVEVTEGQSVKFRVKVKGYPPPRVSWYKDGTLLKTSKACRIEKFGNRDYILIIDHTSMNDDAEYTVTARNVAGEQSMSAQVIVDPLSDLPVRKQHISSTTTSGVSDSDSDPSMSYNSHNVPAKSVTESTGFSSRSAKLTVQERESKLPSNHLTRNTALTQKQNETPNKRMINSDVLDVLKLAEDIIQRENHSSINYPSQRWSGKESVSSNVTESKNMKSTMFLTDKTDPANFILPETLDDVLLSNCDMESSKEFQSNLDYSAHDIRKHQDLKEQYSRDFEIHQTTKKQKSLVKVEPFTHQVQSEVIIRQKSTDRTDEKGESSSQCSSPRQSIDSGVYVSSKWEQPLVMNATRHTNEDNVPGIENNETCSIELPSVDKLKAVFSSVEDDEDLENGTFIRVHSITARNVPKEKLEKFRATNQSQTPSSLSSASLGVPGSSLQASQALLEPVQTNNKTSLLLLSEDKNMAEPSLVHSTSSRNTLRENKSPSMLVHRSLETRKDPVLIFPETHPEYMQRRHTQQKESSRPTPKARTTLLVPQQNQQQTLNQISAVTEQQLPKSPSLPSQRQRQSKVTNQIVVPLDKKDIVSGARIKTGSISARTAFWERKIIEGGAENDEEFPEMLESTDL